MSGCEEIAVLFRVLVFLKLLILLCHVHLSSGSSDQQYVLRGMSLMAKGHKRQGNLSLGLVCYIITLSYKLGLRDLPVVLEGVLST